MKRLDIDDFELGDININNYGWSYLNDSTYSLARVRLKEDVHLIVKAGDKIDFPFDSEYEYQLGLKQGYSYDYVDWQSGSYTFDGRYEVVILIRSEQESITNPQPINFRDAAETMVDAFKVKFPIWLFLKGGDNFV